VPSLLTTDEPAPVLTNGHRDQSPFVLVVDHASARIPKRLHALGLTPDTLTRHIAWDIGALAVAQLIAHKLDATWVAQQYSRLVIDCNRHPNAESSITALSEYTVIPGNQHLTAQDILARRQEIFEPYHAHLCALLDHRARLGLQTILVAQHTMTDCYKGIQRDMHAAVLYNRDTRFAQHMLYHLRRNTGCVIADNEPYFLSDATDYTIPVHAETHGLPYVEIEIRQDLVSTAEGQAEWSEHITRALEASLQSLT